MEIVWEDKQILFRFWNSFHSLQAASRKIAINTAKTKIPFFTAVTSFIVLPWKRLDVYKRQAVSRAACIALVSDSTLFLPASLLLSCADIFPDGTFFYRDRDSSRRPDWQGPRYWSWFRCGHRGDDSEDVYKRQVQPRLYSDHLGLRI